MAIINRLSINFQFRLLFSFYYIRLINDDVPPQKNTVKGMANGAFIIKFCTTHIFMNLLKKLKEKEKISYDVVVVVVYIFQGSCLHACA